MTGVRSYWDARRATAIVKSGGGVGLRMAAQYILDESRKQVPIDTGALSRSGSIDTDETKMAATVSYDTPYAVKQHENLKYRHKPGRKAKYLEDPVNSSSTKSAIMRFFKGEIKF